jgi:DNA invertase Pin-like site-specific DNA recombinase
LAVAKLDRLSRKTEDALRIFSDLGERLLSCDVPNMDKFTLTIFTAIADRERELISLRTTGALQAKVKRLQANGEPTNWRTSERQTWSVEAREKSVRTIRDNAATNEHTNRARDYARMLRTEKGMTLAAIADYLNERKFVTARGKAFQKTSVLRLLE